MPPKKFKPIDLNATKSTVLPAPPTPEPLPPPPPPVEAKPQYLIIEPKKPPSQLMTKDGSIVRKLGKDGLHAHWSQITGRVLEYLNGYDKKTGEPRIIKLLEETKLKDIGVFAAISTDKLLLLEGQPTTIIGQAESEKLEKLLPALLEEIKRRGTKVELTERKATITNS